MTNICKGCGVGLLVESEIHCYDCDDALRKASKKEADRKYRSENKSKIAKREHKYRQEHKAQISNRMKRYYQSKKI